MSEPTDYYRQYCASSLVHIASASDVATLRTSLLTALWPGPNALPTRAVDTIQTGASPYTTTGQVAGWGTNLASTELWTINTASSHHSYVYVYRPTTAPATVGNRIAICHHGHEDHGYGVENLVQQCVATTLATAASITALNNLSTAQVLAQIETALATTTRTLPGQTTPSQTPTLAAMIEQLYKLAINPSDQSATEQKHYASNGTTVDQKRTVSDDNTTFTHGALVTGP